MQSEQREKLSRSIKMKEHNKTRKRNRNAVMRQLDKDESLHGNTGKKTDDLRESPRNYFQTFKPFLGSSNRVKGSDVNLKVDGKIISN